MPNLCENNLTIAFDPATTDIDELLGSLRGEAGRLSFAAGVPVPREAASDTAAWCSENWGTRCEPMEATGELNLDDERAVRAFIFTAWAPPTAWLTHMSGLFPNAEFRLEYLEQGFDFSGVAEAKAGECIDIEDGWSENHTRKVLMGEPAEDVVEGLLEDPDVLHELLADKALHPDLLTELRTRLSTPEGLDMCNFTVQEHLDTIAAHPNYRVLSDTADISSYH